MITLKTFIVKRFLSARDKLQLLRNKRRKSVGRDFGQSHAVSLEISRTADKFDGVVIFAELDDLLKYRVGAEVPKSDRQSFFRLPCTAYTNADCRTNTRAEFFLKKSTVI